MSEKKIVFSNHAIKRMCERIAIHNEQYNIQLTYEAVQNMIIQDATRIEETSNGAARIIENDYPCPCIKHVAASVEDQVTIITMGLFYRNRIHKTKLTTFPRNDENEIKWKKSRKEFKKKWKVESNSYKKRKRELKDITSSRIEEFL